MSLKIGRQGYLGLGIESTPGTPVGATVTIPFVTNTLQGKHTPIKDISARASRAQDFTSVQGKKWGEGGVDVNVDTINIGYFLKLALGNEIVNTVQAGVYDHIFYTTTSGNQPTTATLYNYQGVDVQEFPSMAIDSFDIDVKDDLMVAKAAFKGFFPTSASDAPTTTSGTVLTFGSYQIQLGSSLINAAIAAATPIVSFALNLKNNAEVIFESGQALASRVYWKQLTIEGEFDMFFESVTLRDNYLNLNKQSMILTASGMSLAGGNAEQLKIQLARLMYSDQSFDTGLENLYQVKTKFIAEVDLAQGKQMDITLRNYKSSTYA